MNHKKYNEYCMFKSKTFKGKYGENGKYMKITSALIV